MDRTESVLTREVRNAVICQAVSARSQRQIGRDVILELLRSGIRPRQVSAGEFKNLLAEAARVRRRSRQAARKNSTDRRSASLRNIQAWARQNQQSVRLDQEPLAGLPGIAPVG